MGYFSSGFSMIIIGSIFFYSAIIFSLSFLSTKCPSLSLLTTISESISWGKIGLVMTSYLGLSLKSLSSESGKLIIFSIIYIFEGGSPFWPGSLPSSIGEGGIWWLNSDLNGLFCGMAVEVLGFIEVDFGVFWLFGFCSSSSLNSLSGELSSSSNFSTLSLAFCYSLETGDLYSMTCLVDGLDKRCWPKYDPLIWWLEENLPSMNLLLFTELIADRWFCGWYFVNDALGLGFVL